MIPHRLTFIAVAASLCVLGAACGSTGSTNSSAPEPKTTESAETTTPVTDTANTDAPVAEIDDTILTTKVDGGIALDGSSPATFDETGLDLEFDLGGEPTPSLLAVFDGEEGLVVIPLDLDTESPSGELYVIRDGITYSTTDASFTESSSIYEASGTLTPTDGGSDVTFELTLPFGVGSSTFELDGNRAILRGDLGARTFDQVQYLIEAHPEVDTLVLQNVPGSENDDVNVETGRLIRAAGYTTYVPADGEIYSGGVDLFTSGAVRIADDGAVIGVHAWCCGPNGESAHLIDQADPAHESQLSYFREMLGDDLGPAFYFYTLNAAPFDGIEPMTRAEMELFGLVTDATVLADPIDRLGDTALFSPSGEIADIDSLVDHVTTVSAAEQVEAELLSVVEGSPTIVRIARTGLADDTIDAELLTFTLEPDADGWNIVALESQASCSRALDDGICS